MSRLSIVALFTSCIIYAQFDATSKWVDVVLRGETPSSSEYYIGIGRVKKGKRTAMEFEKEAKQLALIDISSQIRTQIISSSKSYVFEDQDTFEKTYESEAASMTYSDMEGLELYRKYSSDTEYFVYYRLNKAEYQKNMEKAVATARSLFDDFIEIDEDSEPIRRLKLLIHCYEYLYKALGGAGVMHQDNEREFNLTSRVQTEIETIVNNIQLKTEKNRYRTVVGERVDDPLKIETDIYLPRGERVPINELPLKFIFTKGNGNFSSSLLVSDEYGVVSTFINKITSKYPTQFVKARIDLKNLTLDPTKPSYLDDYFEKLSNNRSITFTLEVSELKNDMIAIFVVGREGVSNPEERIVNRHFEESFSKITDFEIKDRTAAEKILENKGWDNATICDDSECQLQVGQLLGVDKMIFAELTYLEGSKEYNCYMSMSDILNKTTTEPTNFELKVKSKDKFGDLKNEIPKWVREFYGSLNPGMITFHNDTPARVNVIIDGKNEGSLPMYEREFKEGNYAIKFASPGYETKEAQFFISPMAAIEQRILLEQKTKGKAFMRSLIFPGRGQWYSADEDHGGRRITGFIFTGLTVASAVASGYLWYNYSLTKATFEQSRNDYLAQVVMGEIEAYKIIMDDDYATMSSSKATASIMTGLFATIWIGSALEAMLNFPSDYGVGASFSYDPSVEQNQLYLYKTF